MISTPSLLARSIRRAATVVALAVAVVFGGVAAAQACTTTFLPGSVWGDPASWSTGQVPGIADTVCVADNVFLEIDAVATPRVARLEIGADSRVSLSAGTFRADSLLVDTATEAVYVNEGAHLVVGDAQINSHLVIDRAMFSVLDGGTINGPGRLAFANDASATPLPLGASTGDFDITIHELAIYGAIDFGDHRVTVAPQLLELHDGSIVTSGRIDLDDALVTGNLRLLGTGDAHWFDVAVPNDWDNDAHVSVDGPTLHVRQDVDLLRTDLIVESGVLVLDEGVTLTATGDPFVHQERGWLELGSGATIQPDAGPATETLALDVRRAQGSVQVDGGRLAFTGALAAIDAGVLQGREWRIENATVEIPDASDHIETLDVDLLLTGSGNIEFASSGDALAQLGAINPGRTMRLRGGADVTTSRPLSSRGTVDLAAGSTLTAASYIQEAGTLRLALAAALTTSGTVTLNGGTVRSAGTITGDVRNVDARIQPEVTHAPIHIVGSFEQGDAGELVLGIASPSAHDQLQVTGAAQLDGTLELSSTSYVPIAALDDITTLVTASSIGGTLVVDDDALTLTSELSLAPVYSATALRLRTVGPAAPSAVRDARASSSHGARPSTDRTIGVQWTAPSYLGRDGNLRGYSWSFTREPSGTPDASVDGSDTRAASGPLPDGTWYLHVRAVAASGSAGVVTHAGPFSIDGTGPTITITQSRVVGSTARVTFTTTEPITRTTCTLDDRPLSNCASPIVLTNLRVGPHELRIDAWDEAGNAALAPGAATLRVLGPTSGADRLVGSAGPDRLFGGVGRDVLLGLAGNDVLFGGAGRDVLRGSAGNDVLSGGSGWDQVIGDAGRDRLIGGPGRDELVGGDGDDVLLARDGDPDTVSCGRGRDTALLDRFDVATRNCERVLRVAAR